MIIWQPNRLFANFSKTKNIVIFCQPLHWKNSDLTIRQLKLSDLVYDIFAQPDKWKGKGSKRNSCKNIKPIVGLVNLKIECLVSGKIILIQPFLTNTNSHF